MADILNPTVWFETDASNASGAQPSWPENMPGKDVNNAARSLQGALKRFADQISATKVTAGTSSAYTVSYTVAPEALYNGQRFCILAHTPCSAAPTLNINSLGAKEIKKLTTTGITSLSANDILINSVLDLVYVSILNQFIWLNSPTAVTGGVAAHTHPQSDITGLVSDLALKAPLLSPAFTATPTAPTPAFGDNSTKLATTSFVTAAVAAGSGGGGTAPVWGAITGTLTSQADLQAALNLKAPLASPTFTGTPVAPTPAALDNTTQLATTAHVYEAITHEHANPKSASYTLIASDAGKVVTFDTPSNCVVNNSVFSANSRVDVIHLGAGQVTFTGSATLRSNPSGANKLIGTYSGATLWFISASEYVLIGGITA